MSELLGLEGKGVVVFGGGDGIGGHTVRQFLTAGAKVVCVDSSEEVGRHTAAAYGGDWIQADALDRASVAAAFGEAARRLGRVDCVVDIIGKAYIGSLLDVTDERLQAQFDIVFRHAVLVLQAGMKHVSRGGSFTFVGSLSGDHAIRDQAIYGASKAALHQLVRSAAQEFGAAGVRVNAVSPGFIRTPRLEQLLSAAQWAKVEGAVPLGRVAQPSEIAGCLIFLASNLASIVTGQVLEADGGVGASAALPVIDWNT